jgi:hypothetical protein
MFDPVDIVCPFWPPIYGGWRLPLGLNLSSFPSGWPFLRELPPSTSRFTPLIYEAEGDSRNATAAETSDSVPNRLLGFYCMQRDPTSVSRSNTRKVERLSHRYLTIQRAC